MVTLPFGKSQDEPCISQYPVVAASEIANDSFAQSLGSELLHRVFISGVIASTRAVAASSTSGPIACRTKQLSHVPCRFPEHCPVRGLLLSLVGERFEPRANCSANYCARPLVFRTVLKLRSRKLWREMSSPTTNCRLFSNL